MLALPYAAVYFYNSSFLELLQDRLPYIIWISASAFKTWGWPQTNSVQREIQHWTSSVGEIIDYRSGDEILTFNPVTNLLNTSPRSHKSSGPQCMHVWEVYYFLLSPFWLYHLAHIFHVTLVWILGLDQINFYDMYLTTFADLCKLFKFPIHFTLIKIGAVEGNQQIKYGTLKRCFAIKWDE